MDALGMHLLYKNTLEKLEKWPGLGLKMPRLLWYSMCVGWGMKRNLETELTTMRNTMALNVGGADHKAKAASFDCDAKGNYDTVVVAAETPNGKATLTLSRSDLIDMLRLLEKCNETAV